MSSGHITKVMKYELRYLDGAGDFKEMQAKLWEFQRQTREILNKTIQIAFDWDYKHSEHLKQTGEKLNLFTETGYKRLDGYIYKSLASDYPDMNKLILNAAIQTAWKKYNDSRKDVFCGKMSIPSYKSDQPILIHKNNVKIYSSDDGIIAEISLLSQEIKKQMVSKTGIRFLISVNDNTQRTIIKNVLNGTYKIGQCQLIYDKPKWFLFLTYSFEPQKYELDSEKILGVDMGECYAIYASSTSEFGNFKISGGEVTEFAKRIEARKRSMQNQARMAGDGRVGHGTKTRVSSIYKIEDKIANFRNTINHRYSKALIDFAVKNHFGIIQMEDLSGIKEDTGFPKLLQHWTYFDLQTKIENKAKEHGITVFKIDPKYTSKRCSKCGNIDENNRKTQSKFVCTKCGFSANADFNASQNISIKNIENIIKETLSAKV